MLLIKVFQKIIVLSPNNRTCKLNAGGRNIGFTNQLPTL